MSAVGASRNKIALAAVCLSAIMLGLEITSIPSILPTLERVLPADFRQLQWIMNSYTIAMCAMLIAMGALADRFGRKRIFMISIVIFGVASLICGLATSAPLLISARFVQGVSAAGMLACQVAVLSHQFRSGPERAIAFSWWGVIFGMGLGTGPVVGGAIVTLASWEWVFLIHVAIAVLAVLLTQVGAQESSDPHSSRIDIGGMVTLPLAVFGFVYLITQGQELGLTSPVALAILGASVLSFVLFVLIEAKVARPMFDFRAFRIRNFSGALLGACGMNFSFWPFIIYFPIYLQSGLGYGGVVSGLIVLAYTLPIVIIPPYAEKLLVRRGPRFVIPLGMFAISLGFLLMRLMATSEFAGWASLLPGCIVAGIGVGLTTTSVTNTTTGALPPERAGMASGMEFSARMISLSVNIAIMGLILVQGVAANLKTVLAEGIADQARRSLIDMVAAGNLDGGAPLGVSSDMARSALTEGIGGVMTYSAIATLVLGLLAVMIFRSKEHPQADQSIGASASVCETDRVCNQRA